MYSEKVQVLPRAAFAMQVMGSKGTFVCNFGHDSPHGCTPSQRFCMQHNNMPKLGSWPRSATNKIVHVHTMLMRVMGFVPDIFPRHAAHNLSQQPVNNSYQVCAKCHVQKLLTQCYPMSCYSTVIVIHHM